MTDQFGKAVGRARAANGIGAIPQGTANALTVVETLGVVNDAGHGSLAKRQRTDARVQS